MGPVTTGRSAVSPGSADASPALPGWELDEDDEQQDRSTGRTAIAETRPWREQRPRRVCIRRMLVRKGLIRHKIPSRALPDGRLRALTSLEGCANESGSMPELPEVEVVRRELVKLREGAIVPL